MQIADLPFVKLNSDETVSSLWNPLVSGEYQKDRQTGADYADALISLMKTQGNMALFGWVIRGFGENPDLSATESGFCQRIAEHALS